MSDDEGAVRVRATVGDAVSTAIALAGAHPGATLPCPRCDAQVRGSNLAGHVEKVHGARAGAASGVLRVRGKDRSARLIFGLSFAGWGVASGVFIAVRGPTPQDVDVALLGVTFLLTFVPLLAALLGVLPATVELEGQNVRLRVLFGLVTRSLALPAELSTGRIVERRTVAGTQQLENAPGEDVRFGSYLRVERAGRAICIGAASAAGLGAHWASSGWKRGREARRWDITIDRIDLIAIEYHLAALGYLAPREAVTP